MIRQSEIKCLGIITEKRHLLYRKVCVFLKFSLNDFSQKQKLQIPTDKYF